MDASALAGRVVPQRHLVAANAAALVLAYAIPRGFTFLAAVVAARVLGPERFGYYATAAAVAVVASIAATLGMQPLLVRQIARSPERAPGLVAAAHVAKVVLVLLMAALLAAAPLAGFHGTILAAAALLGVGYAVGAFVENLAAYFQGVERMHVWTQASALMGVVTGATGIALVLLTRSVVWLCAAPALGQAAALGWLLHSAPARVRHPAHPAAADVTALLRRLAPFAAAFLGTTIFYRIDILLLSRIRGAAEVGIYGAAYRFLDVVQALALAGGGALLPMLARRRGARGADAARLLARVAAITLPVALAIFMLRDPLIGALFGPDYAAAAPVLAVLAPAAVPLAVNMVALSALAAADAMAPTAVLFVAAAAVDVALNLAWVPGHGAMGSAAAAVVAESALAAGLASLLVRRSDG